MVNKSLRRLVAAALCTFALCVLTSLGYTQQAAPKTALQKHRNVIIFVADGLRRGSVTAEDMPTFFKARAQGVDFRDSHAVFPTFTTSNASVIATGHAVGDTGDYGNFLFPGSWLTKPDPRSPGIVTPFLENNDILADLNHLFNGNYLGERTLLSFAHENGYNVASVGKLGPTGIQQNESIAWDQLNFLTGGDAIIVDDATGKPNGIPLPVDINDALLKMHLEQDSPARNNGYADSSHGNNNNSGDAVTPGTDVANVVQQRWFTDVSTKVLLPRFAADSKPFLFLFWSRDPDGTQHNEGDSVQSLKPGINGPTSKLGLQNADRCLAQLLAWLDAHPDIKANTDVILTSDHGFATISQREIDANGATTSEVSANIAYENSGTNHARPQGMLPLGFLAIDLAVREGLRIFDAGIRATEGSSPYQEILLNGEKPHFPSTGSALLGHDIHSIDGSDASLIVTANGGADLIYVPTKDPKIVHDTLDILLNLDYMGAIFIDDAYCPQTTSCPGALPLSSVGMVGNSKILRPAIVLTYKVFYLQPGDLQSAIQISNYPLHEGEGMHGGLGREQTLNNMAAFGPDFRKGFVDEEPSGNIDIVPTLTKVLGLDIPSNGSMKGRVLTEALAGGSAQSAPPAKSVLSAPTENGTRTLLQYQEQNGVRYYDKACLVTSETATCP